jgi:FAD/FMN-containing dehydrogenase
MAVCNDAKQRVVAHGGRTGLVQSSISTAEDVVLSLERMNRIEEIDEVGRTMTVQAGVPLQILQDAAASKSLFFPVDLGARGSCQIGGNVSTNAGGNRVIRFGMMRDNVLGIEAVLADGTIVSSLNTMIKNNAGYDLKQLFIGSEGTLGIVTRLVLRLREAVTEQETAFVSFDTFAQVTGFLKYVDGALGGKLSAYEVLWHDYYDLVTTAPATNKPPVEKTRPYYAIVESLGSVKDRDGFETIMFKALEDGLIADAAVAQSGSDSAAIWKIRDDVEHMFRYGRPQIFDVSIAIKHIGAYVEEVKRRLEVNWTQHHCFTFGHIGDGNIHFAITVPDAAPGDHRKVEECVYEPLRPYGGSVSAEHGIGLEKKDFLPISRTAAEIALMRRLKQSLDPNGILNPGKIFEFEGAT